ncbi:MAG: WD40 repeat domain-containing protein [candidate division Zixibacteria bacterium]|nr:WD40 repeat domain-containing protein [candidate division Zixibacteria bacterium]
MLVNTKQGLDPYFQSRIGDYVNSLSWSPDGKRLATAAISGSVVVFDLSESKIHDLEGHRFGATALSWHPRGLLLASAGQDGKARVWDAMRGQELFNLDGGASWVECAAWSPNGDWLATAAGREVRFWNTTGDQVSSTKAFESTVADIAWAPDGNILAAAAYGGLTLLDAKDARQVRFEWKGSSLVTVWSPDGRFIVTGDQDATVHFWYTDTGQDLQMSGYETKVRELSWNATSRYLATGGGKAVVVWDCSGKGPAGTRPTMLRFHQDVLTAVAFQNRSKRLASASLDGYVAIWKDATSQSLHRQIRLETEVSRLAWSPDDRSLAVGDASGQVTVFAVP